MKRTVLVVVAAALVIGCLQWWQLAVLRKQDMHLADRMRKAQPKLSATPPPPQSERADTADGKPMNAGLSLPQPVEVEEFFILARDISQLGRQLSAGDDQSEYRTKILALLSRLPATPHPDLKAIMERLEESEMDAEDKRQISSAIINLLAETDPAATVTFALRSQAKPAVVESALRKWAQQDPQAAGAWLENAETQEILRASPGFDRFHRILLPSLIADDPAGGAVDQLARLPAPDLGDVLAEAVGLIPTREERRALLQRIDQIDGLPIDARELLLEHIAHSVSISEATGLLAESGGGFKPEQFDRLAATLAASHIDTGTPLLANWLLQNLRAEERGPAIGAFMQAWAKADFNMAASWLREQPASTDRDLAVASFAVEIARMEPGSAVDWARLIADPVRQAAVMKTVDEQWRTASPEAADAYFKQSKWQAP